MYEKIVSVKRTIWVAECKCGNRVETDNYPPKERFCNCGEWVPYVEVSYTGPELTKR